MTELLTIQNIAIPVSIPFSTSDFELTLNYYPNYRKIVLSNGGKPLAFANYLATFCKWLEMHPEVVVERHIRDWTVQYMTHYGLADFMRRAEGDGDEMTRGQAMDLANFLERNKQI